MWDYCITEVETAAFTWRRRAAARPLRLFASQPFMHCVSVCVCQQQSHVFQVYLQPMDALPQTSTRGQHSSSFRKKSLSRFYTMVLIG